MSHRGRTLEHFQRCRGLLFEESYGGKSEVVSGSSKEMFGRKSAKGNSLLSFMEICNNDTGRRKRRLVRKRNQEVLILEITGGEERNAEARTDVGSR